MSWRSPPISARRRSPCAPAACARGSFSTDLGLLKPRAWRIAGNGAAALSRTTGVSSRPPRSVSAMAFPSVRLSFVTAAADSGQWRAAHHAHLRQTGRRPPRRTGDQAGNQRCRCATCCAMSSPTAPARRPTLPAMMWAARPARPRCRARTVTIIPHALRTSFCAVFPVHNPRYIVFVLLDQPHGTKETGGFALAGYTAAPLAGKVIARIAPLAGRSKQRAAGHVGPQEFIMAPQSVPGVGQERINAMVAAKDFTGLTSDSRKVKPGYLFAALAGTQDRRRALHCTMRWNAAP